MSRVDAELRADLRGLADRVELDSVARGTVTVDQAAGIDWVDLLVRAVSHDDA